MRRVNLLDLSTLSFGKKYELWNGQAPEYLFIWEVDSLGIGCDEGGIISLTDLHRLT